MIGHRCSSCSRGLLALAAIVMLCVPLVADAAARPLTPAPMVTLLAATGSQPIATLEASRGRVSVIRLGRSEAPTAAMPLELDDIIVTRDGRATVRFLNDGTVLRIGPDSRVQINESAGQRDVTVFFGRLWAHVVKFKEQTTRFATSSTIAAIRGTEISLGVAVDGDETQLSVLEGQVEAQTDAGSLMVEGGQTVSGKKGKAPARSFGVKPADAVQWSLYYLPVLYTAPGELGAGQPWQGKATESTTACDMRTTVGAISRPLSSWPLALYFRNNSRPMRQSEKKPPSAFTLRRQRPPDAYSSSCGMGLFHCARNE